MNEQEKFVNRQCKGKRRITGRSKARYVAAKMSRRNKTQFAAYQCEICGYYHVGHAKTPFRRFMLTPHRRGSLEVRVSTTLP